MVSITKRNIVVGGIFILLLLIGISWRIQVSRYSIPSFVMKISENQPITNNSLKGYRSCFLIMNNLNAFNLMLIKKLSEHINFE